jgi:WD40 repeat protein/serine/threonine protein kinase
MASDEKKPANSVPSPDEAQTLSHVNIPRPARRGMARSFEDETKPAPKPPAPKPADDDCVTMTKGGGSPPAAPPDDAMTLTKGVTARRPQRKSFDPDSTPDAGMTLTKGGAEPPDELTMTKGAVPVPTAPQPSATIDERSQYLSVMLGARGTTMLNKVVWDVGDVIAGKYEVTAIAGKGGMGVVYKVRHREWNIDMAVKTPLPNLVQDEVSRSRFLREAQTWVDLGLHPNLVQCWYVRELGGLPRLFVDFMEGGSLKDWVENGRLGLGDWSAIIDMIVQACDGLGYAHERGVIHRDIKPANMLMTIDGRLCVTDFGLVKVSGVEEIADGGSRSPSSTVQSLQSIHNDLTMTGSNMGTPQYGAPEQWGEARHVDARSDLYALGITLYELCAGRRPFDDRTHREPAHVIIGRHLTTTAPDPRTFRPDIPEALAKIALKCLAKKPDDRYPSLRVLREVLAEAHQEILGRPLARQVPHVAGARAAALNNRAVSMWDLGIRNEALAAWQEALKLDPQHAESIYNLGLLEWREGKATGDQIMLRLSDNKNNSKRALLYRGYLNLEGNSPAECEKDLTEAVTDEAIAKDAAAWRTLGHAQMAQLKFELAQGSYAKALQLTPSDEIAEACLNLAKRGVRIADSSSEKTPWGLFPNVECERVFVDRGGSIRSIAMSPDGKSAMTEGLLGALSRWELSSGRLVKQHSVHSKTANCVAMTPDGSCSVSGGEDSVVKMWNLVTDHPAADFFGKGHIGAINAITVTPDGKHAITGGADNSVRIWELVKGYLIKTLWGHQRGVSALVVSSDGKAIISASDDATIRLWNFATGTCTATLSQELKPVQAIYLLPSGKSLLSAGAEGQLLLWNLETQKVEKSYIGHRGSVHCVTMTPDGQTIFSGGADHTIRMWDFASGRCVSTMKGHTGTVQAMAVTPDGVHLLAGSAETEGKPLRLWKIERVPGGSELYSAALSVCRVQNQLQSSSASQQFEQYLAKAEAAHKSGNERESYEALKLARMVSGYERDPRALALNADLSRTVSRTRLSDAYLRLATPAAHGQGVRSVALNALGTRAVSCGRQDKSICLWDAASGKLIRKLEGHKQPVQAAAFNQRGDAIVSGSQDFTAAVWDTESGQQFKLLTGHRGEVNAVFFRLDGKFVLTGSSDGSLRYWDVAAGKCMKVMESGQPVLAVSLLRDNRFIASGHADGSVQLWSLVSGKCMRTFKGHSGAICDLAFTPDSRAIVSGGEDKTLRVWNVDSGNCMQTIKDGRSRFQTLAISPDSRYVFTGGLEGPETPLRMWELATGQNLGAYAKHAKGICALAMTADGCMLVSGGEDTMRIWDLEWELDPTRRVTLPTLKDLPRKTS